MGSIWQDSIPLELISEIFKHLPRRDLYSCYQVCQKWKGPWTTPNYGRKSSFTSIETSLVNIGEMNLHQKMS
nr:unnamed protein product [Callosobruchus analis]